MAKRRGNSKGQQKLQRFCKVAAALHTKTIVPRDSEVTVETKVQDAPNDDRSPIGRWLAKRRPVPVTS